MGAIAPIAPLDPPLSLTLILTLIINHNPYPTLIPNSNLNVKTCPILVNEVWGGGRSELIPRLSHQPAVGMRRARSTVRWPVYLSVLRLTAALLNSRSSFYG